MEIAIAAFIGIWLSFFSIWAYTRLKKDYAEQGTKNTDRSKGEQES